MGDWPSHGVDPGGMIVPGWRVVAPLGGGKVTEVVRAEDAHGRHVVVKVARPGLEDRARGSLRAEGELLRRLDGPTLPRLLESAVDHQPPYIVIEHVAGLRLSTRVRRRGPLSAPEAGRLGLGLVRALREVHALGWVHLDVKPGNVVLGSPPRLVDLGIAKPLERACAARGTIGTQRWMSPEQRDPERFGGLGPPADVWGVGATLFFAVTGSGPFDSVRVAPRTYDVDDDVIASLDLPGGVPGPLATAVLSCLRLRPGDRPTLDQLTVALRLAVLGAADQ